MTKGIKIKDLQNGSGRQACKQDHVLVECLFSLNHGEQINLFPNDHQNQFVIHLASRDFFPGLLQGIVGMFEGGVRQLRVSPHLAYGEKGVEGIVPPNAVLICKVTLIKIVDASFTLPSPIMIQRQILIQHGGEALNNKPRWVFGAMNDGQYSLRVHYPIPGLTWRYTKDKENEGFFSKSEMDTFFNELFTFTKEYPTDIVAYKNVYSDTREKASHTSRERGSDLICLYILLIAKDEIISTYYVTENNPAFAELAITRTIYQLLEKISSE